MDITETRRKTLEINIKDAEALIKMLERAEDPDDVTRENLQRARADLEHWTAKYNELFPEEYDTGSDWQLGKYDAEVMNGAGYYNENGRFIRYGGTE